MSLIESTVEDAALTWFEEPDYAVGHGPEVASLGQIQSSPALATLLPKLLSVAAIQVKLEFNS